MERINLAFATPLYRVTLEGVDQLNVSLEKLILSLEDAGHRKKNSPQAMPDAVFESEFDFLKRSEPEVRQLRDLLYAALASFVKEINGFTDEELAKLKFNNHAWFHVTRSGGYFQAHNHPNASWSVVYYINPGDPEPKNEKAAGHIVFHDPRPQASCYQDAANSRMRREFSYSGIRIRPVAGELLIFPSYVLHHVEPYEGDIPRVNVASNFWFYL
ncbi:MAG: 2OG-Fe(II) oxygenase family protein [Proteobacteria bacterium]|nr:2OG-Fe(II) oxygenase family protein [Pseudomonadota bacterium]